MVTMGDIFWPSFGVLHCGMGMEGAVGDGSVGGEDESKIPLSLFFFFFLGGGLAGGEGWSCWLRFVSIKQ